MKRFHQVQTSAWVLELLKCLKLLKCSKISDDNIMMRGSCYLSWYCAEPQALKLLDEEVSCIWTRIWQWNKVTYSRCSYEHKFCAVSWCSSNCPKWMMRSSISFLSYYITAATRSIVILKVQPPRRIKNVLRFVTGDTKNNFVRVKCWNLAHNRVSISVSFFFFSFFNCKRSKTAMEIHSLLHFEQCVQPSSCVSSKYGM